MTLTNQPDIINTTMIELEYAILALVIGFAIGYKVCETVSALALRELLEDLGIKNKDLVALLEKQSQPQGRPEKEVELRIEHHQGQLLAYEKQPIARFVAQSNTAEELLERLVQFYPVNTRLNISRTDGSDLMQHLLGPRTQ